MMYLSIQLLRRFQVFVFRVVQPFQAYEKHLRKFKAVQKLITPPAKTPLYPNHPHTANVAKKLRRINLPDLINTAAGFGATLNAITYASIRHAVNFQKLVTRLIPVILERFKSTIGWIRANPRQAAAIFSGISILALTLATPAILGAVGFGALGPTASSAAAGWQASIGLVTAKSAFSFLQSAAMGGAAMGLITGVGVAGGVIPIVVALPMKTETVRIVVGGIKRVADTATNTIKEAADTATGSAKDVLDGALKKITSLFGKWKQE